MLGILVSKIIKNQTTIPQLIANNMSGCFFLKHGVEMTTDQLKSNQIKSNYFISSKPKYNITKTKQSNWLTAA